MAWRFPCHRARNEKRELEKEVAEARFKAEAARLVEENQKELRRVTQVGSPRCSQAGHLEQRSSPTQVSTMAGQACVIPQDAMVPQELEEVMAMG